MSDQDHRKLQYVEIVPISPPGKTVVQYFDAKQGKKEYRKALKRALEERKSVLIALRGEDHGIIMSARSDLAINLPVVKRSGIFQATPAWATKRA